jgi:hypothetical protein
MVRRIPFGSLARGAVRFLASRFGVARYAATIG